ncbi:Zinc metalloproteinase nas-15, partial [Hondaea fermentalgiana]
MARALLLLALVACARSQELFEGDIAATAEQVLLSYGDAAEAVAMQLPHEAAAQGLIRDRRWLWPDGIMPYTIGDFTASRSATILAAIDEMNEAFEGALTLRERTTEKAYVQISGDTAGCWATIGYNGAKSTVNVGGACADHKDVVQHELLHVAGIWHEQSRPDRDDYIRIIEENIQDGKASNFLKRSSSSVDSRGFVYDYKSVMHYYAKAFSKNGKPTIESLTPGETIGGDRMTSNDIAQVIALYRDTRATETPTGVPTGTPTGAPTGTPITVP